MKRGILWGAIALVLLNLGLLFVFLWRPTPSAVTPEGKVARVSDGQPGVYMVTGEVRELLTGGSNVLIKHEAIPGYMMAMTMPFATRDPREVASLQPGDRVTFRLLVTDDESWIDSVERLGQSARLPTFVPEQTRIVRDVDPLELGDVVPDYVFTNQLGQPTKLSDFRGQALGVTFMFTRCPLPDFCPRMLKNFAAVAEKLKTEPGPTNWHLATITIDPTYDTPPVLRAHAQTYDYDPDRWTFLTGAMIDIDAITEQVGLAFRRQTPTALPDHNLRTFVVDPQGRLTKIIIGNTWKPEEVVEEIRAVAGRTE